MIFFSIFRETDNKYFSRTFTINLIPDRKQDKKNMYCNYWKQIKHTLATGSIVNKFKAALFLLNEL